MKALVIVTPFTHDKYTGKKFQARKSWASVDNLVTVDICGKFITAKLDSPAPVGFRGQVEIIGKEVGFWYGRYYTHLAVCI